MREKRKRLNLQDLSWFDISLIFFYAVWVSLRRQPLPRPVHFAVVASLSMIMLMPVMPHHPLAIPIIIGGGLAFAITTSWR